MGIFTVTEVNSDAIGRKTTHWIIILKIVDATIP